MFDIIKTISVSLAVLFLSACSAVPRGEIASDEFETEYSSVYAERVVFEGLSNEEYQSQLNMEIDEEVTYAVNEFDAMAQEVKPDMPENVKSILNITQKIKSIRPYFISEVEEHYVYIGGSHGTTSWFTRNICLSDETPHKLVLKELFTDDTYMEKLNLIIKQMVEEDTEKYSGLWDEPIIDEENGDRFYITDTDLVIYFPPYTLSYYAKGFIEFPIRLTEIEGLLKPEYREVLIGREN